MSAVMSYGRALAAKTLELAGMVIVGMALVIGLRDDDMTRELAALAFGSAVFIAGYLLDPRDPS